MPKICMACGKPAVKHIEKNFSWYPPWLWVLILVGPLVFIIVGLIITERMFVDVPVCNRHRGYWFKRLSLMWLPPILVGCSCLVVIALLANKPKYEPAIGFIILGASMFCLIWLIGSLIVSFGLVRPTEITRNDITLTNVSPEFLHALDDLHEEERQYRRKNRQRGRSRSQDDYYDDEESDQDYRGPGRPPPLPPREPPPRRVNDEEEGRFRGERYS